MRGFLKISLLITAVTGTITGCSPGTAALKMSELRNYNAASAQHILFLNFEIQQKGRSEKVTLVDATAGNGKLKDLSRPVHGPYRVEVVAHYAGSLPDKEMIFEHPLHRHAEVPGQDGKLEATEVTSEKGNLLIRIQEDNNLQSLSLFSMTPQRGKVQIYTIDFSR